MPAFAVTASKTLDHVRRDDALSCGVSTGLPGFSLSDSQGHYQGLDVDICRAVAAAVLGDSNKVRYVPLSPQQRFTSLQSGDIDILSRNTTVTLQREGGGGILFAPPVFYDGQGFLVPKRLHIHSVKDLAGATICIQPGTTTELNLADYFRNAGLSFHPVIIDNFDTIENSFFAGRCDAFTTDASGLAAARASRAPNPDDYLVLTDLISKEPLAPAVRQGDDRWYVIVRWVVYAVIEAEEAGVTSQNIDEQAAHGTPAVKRLLGTSPGMGKALGLDDAWAYRIIKQIGNYGEIFDRNVGPSSALKLERGVNALWTKGGLLYAPPLL